MVNSELYTKEQLQELAFTKEELDRLAAAKKMPLTFDEDCPPTTAETALRFRRVNPSRRAAEAN